MNIVERSVLLSRLANGENTDSWPLYGSGNYGEGA